MAACGAVIVALGHEMAGLCSNDEDLAAAINAGLGLMGVAWWILPKYPRLPERGPAAPVWAAWLLLNAGVVLAGVGRSVGAPDGVRVDYVRAVAPGDETEIRRNGAIVHSYTLR